MTNFIDFFELNWEFPIGYATIVLIIYLIMIVYFKNPRVDRWWGTKIKTTIRSCDMRDFSLIISSLTLVLIFLATKFLCDYQQTSVFDDDGIMILLLTSLFSSFLVEAMRYCIVKSIED